MVKVKFSQNYWAAIKRIQRLPKLQWTKTAIDTITKKDAEGFIEEYKKGIREDSFRLTPLAPSTVRQKISKGQAQPTTPLYGAGESEKNSLINALRIRKIKKGYRVFVSRAKHHKSNLPLNVLFSIHSNGALIRRVTKKGRPYIIRIPPRPTRKKAFKRYIAKRLRGENVQKVREAMIKYLKTGTIRDISRL